MREIQLANGKGVALVDDDAHIERPWLVERSWHIAPPTKKTNKTAYAHATIRNKEGIKTTMLMHRYIMFNWPEPTEAKGLEVDHEDHNGLNNQSYNIRVFPGAQNVIREGPRLNRKYKGISWHKRIKRWAAMVYNGEKNIHLGYFNNEEDAARAYDAGIKHYRPNDYWNGLAYLNFPEVRTLVLAQKTLDNFQQVLDTIEQPDPLEACG